MMPSAVSLSAFGCSGTLAVTDPRALPDASRKITQLIADIDRACSRFRDDSEIVALSRTAGATTPLSPLLSAVLRRALDAAEQTAGLVDPTIGGAMNGAGYDRDLAALETRPDDISPIPAAGWRTVNLDDETRTLWMPPGTALDVGAVGKAWAADLASRLLATDFACGVLVAFGGDVSVAGDPPADGWTIRISEQHQDVGPWSVDQTITIDTGGVATSSTQHRQWRRGHRVCHHILDPATGLPAPVVWRMVTVAAETCADANAASTAAVILGEDAPEWLADRQLPARLVRDDGRITTVAAWPNDIAVVSA
ncbi:MAG: FAD:protein transferase [Frankiales bacterium]|jgi:thiamine biosynthesis lipoprotein|nr:FAD:protein transferase [Frankiales bacterium]